jgi:DNA-directed RNA polymerase sigma subunit (sigma70/sigma32)
MHTCERDLVAYARARRQERGARAELMTFEEIGAAFGVSDERARQTLLRAIVKLRERGETLDEYLAAHEVA